MPDDPGDHDGIDGVEQLDKIIAIDQSPIGRTPRSNPATYTGVFDLIRDLFCSDHRCEGEGILKGTVQLQREGRSMRGSCSGDGIIKIEMHFLPDVYIALRGLRRKAVQP